MTRRHQQDRRGAAASRRVIGMCLGTALAALAAVMVWSPWREKPTAAPWNVVLITLDTTRADRLGCYGAQHDTPTIDTLSRQGVRFENCYCPAPLTLPSHCSLMTGLVPLRHGVHDNGPDRLDSEAKTLAKVLSAQGYDTAAVVGAFVLDHRFGLDQGFLHYDDQMPPGNAFNKFNYAQRNAAQVTDAALDWVKQPRDAPAFLWVHYFDAHAPYAPPGYDPKFTTLRPYDAEIAYVDAQLKRLLDGIERHVSGPTLVMLTADHGEGLGQHGETTHGLFTYNQTLRVPLVVRFPDRRYAGRVVRARVGLIDVMPSILAWLELVPTGQLDGRPLPLADVGGTTDGESRAVYFENRFPTSAYGWSSQDGIVVNPYKLIRAPRPELYDLDRDPKEQTNLFDATTKVSRRLMTRLDELTMELTARPALAPHTATVSDDDLARLRSLGYVGAAKPASNPMAPPELLPDPKDMLEVYDRIQDVTILVEQRQVTRATEMLLEILESKDPYNKRALRLLAATSLDEAGLRDRAIACLQKAASRSDRPCTDTFVLGKLGLTLLADHRPADATDVFQRVLNLEPNSAAACRYLAEACRQQGDTVHAARWQQRAMALAKPSDQPPDWAADTQGRNSVPSYR